LSGSQSLTNIKGNPTSTTITGQTDNAISLLNSATSKIGILRTTTLDSIWDNRMYANGGMSASKSGEVVNTKHHCTFGIPPLCSFDEHLIKTEIELNANSQAKPYAATETCNASTPIVADTYDLEKVVSHELYHTMGFAHSGEIASPIYVQYSCGASYGYSLTSHDDDSIEDKYP